MSRHRLVHVKPSRLTISAAAGTAMVAAAAVAVLAADPASIWPVSVDLRSGWPAGRLVRSEAQVSPGFLRAPTRPVASDRAVLRLSALAETGPAVLRAQVMRARRPGQVAVPSGSPQQLALAMLAGFGWPASQFGCLNELWTRESNWNPAAENPYSGAFGIPQALPGSKMATAGADWATNPATQIKWGLGYIKALYGSPCGAWGHELGYGSY